MQDSERQRILRALILIGVLYILARYGDWTGPYSTIRFDPIIFPGIALITLWGLWRLLNGGPRCG